MKVVAVNSSPNMDKGNTALILGPFLEGMREAGAEVELFYTRKLKINPCNGEFNCWIKTPGKCYQDDDMSIVFPRLVEAEIWVFATPLYVDGVSGPMKNLLDRLLPILHPFFELRDNHCRHPRREEARVSRIALVSNCGFWELDNFDAMIMHMKAASKNLGVEFAGALLRPQGPALRRVMALGMPVDDIFAAIKEAGRQLVVDGKMSPETLKIASREILPREEYIQIANQGVQKLLEK